MNVFDRLSDYDVYAHFSQGLLALASIDYVCGTRFVVGANWNVADGVFILLASYVVGHVVASPASAFLERLLARGVLRPPTKHLLTAKPNKSVFRFLLGDYFRPIEDDLRQKILQKMGSVDPDTLSGERLFWMAYPTALADERARPRLNSFLNIYGFCRNISFLALCTAVALLTGIALHEVDPAKMPVALCLGFVGFLMLARFLKYYRLYALEVLLAFNRA